MTNCIEINGLCKTYPDFALKDVSFTVPAGSIMGFVGENGAGKTTTIRCLLGLARPDSGTIRLLGRDAVQDGSVKEEVGVVLDECFFHDDLTPRAVGQLMSTLVGRWDPALYQDHLARFDLPQSKRVKEFSRGMKMKLSLAVALARQPRLLVLDEATAGLDPVVRDEVLEQLQSFVEDEEHGVLISSHITTDLEKVADYVTFLHRGQVLLSDAKDEILGRYGRLACTAQQLDSVASDDLLRVRRGSFGCQALVSDRMAFHKKYPQLMVEPTTLEEIILMIGRGEPQ